MHLEIESRIEDASPDSAFFAAGRFHHPARIYLYNIVSFRAVGGRVPRNIEGVSTSIEHQGWWVYCGLRPVEVVASMGGGHGPKVHSNCLIHFWWSGSSFASSSSKLGLALLDVCVVLGDHGGSPCVGDTVSPFASHRKHRQENSSKRLTLVGMAAAIVDEFEASVSGQCGDGTVVKALGWLGVPSSSSESLLRIGRGVQMRVWTRIPRCSTVPACSTCFPAFTKCGYLTTSGP